MAAIARNDSSVSGSSVLHLAAFRFISCVISRMSVMCKPGMRWSNGNAIFEQQPLNFISNVIKLRAERNQRCVKMSLSRCLSPTPDAHLYF